MPENHKTVFSVFSRKDPILTPLLSFHSKLLYGNLMSAWLR